MKVLNFIVDVFAFQLFVKTARAVIDTNQYKIITTRNRLHDLQIWTEARAIAMIVKYNRITFWRGCLCGHIDSNKFAKSLVLYLCGFTVCQRKEAFLFSMRQ